MNFQPIIVIAGPTASGKSDVSIEIARRINGEVVVADSMQVYRYMDIGTAKINQSNTDIVHYGINLVNPSESFSASLYQNYARESFKTISSKGKRIILSGGTGFYIRASIDDYNFPKGEQIDNPIREKCIKLANTEGAVALWNFLYELDSESAKQVHPNNVKRVSRAIELYYDGQSYAEQLKNLNQIKQQYNAYLFCLDVDKSILIERINKRVDKMREKGLIDEVKSLIDRGYRQAVTASSAIGYKEIVDAFDCKCTYDEAFEQIKIATRRYAKRQRSWFRGDSRYNHIDVTKLSVIQVADIIEEYVNYYDETFKQLDIKS